MMLIHASAHCRRPALFLIPRVTPQRHSSATVTISARLESLPRNGQQREDEGTTLIRPAAKDKNYHRRTEMRILLIEDNVELADAVAEYFRHHGHPLDWVSSAEQAEKVLAYQSFELLILDINLPGKDGYQLLKALRRQGNQVPVLVLTARAEIDDRVSALDLGADDYLVKPFDFRELAARTRALLRRDRGNASNEVRCGNLLFDPASRQVFINDEPIDLRHREVQLLEVFLGALDHVLTKEDIADRLYTFDEAHTPNAIEQTLTRLRKRLDGSSLVIKTIRGMGYLAHVDD